MTRWRIDCEIEDDTLHLHARVPIGDPGEFDPGSVMGRIEAAVGAALDDWRDGQRAAAGYESEVGSAYERRLPGPGVAGGFGAR